MSEEELKFIVTKIEKKHPKHNFSEVYVIPIDIDYGRIMGDAKEILCAGDFDLQVGDIVNPNNNYKYVKKQYSNSIHAVVIGAHPRSGGRVLTVFSPKIGEHNIALMWDEKYSYTETGHEVIVEKRLGVNNNEYYAIVDNLTVNKIRADFLNHQR